MTQENKIMRLAAKHQMLPMILQGFGPQYIQQTLGIAPSTYNDYLSEIRKDLSSDLSDLAGSIVAVSAFRLESLISRNMALLEQMESVNPKDENAPQLSIRDYTNVTKTVAGLIDQQVKLVTSDSAKAGDVIPGHLAQPDASRTLDEAEDFMDAMLFEIATEYLEERSRSEVQEIPDS